MENSKFKEVRLLKKKKNELVVDLVKGYERKKERVG